MTATLLSEHAHEMFVDDVALVTRRYLLQDDAGQRVEAAVFGRVGLPPRTCTIAVTSKRLGTVAAICVSLDSLRALIATTSEPLARPEQRPGGDGR